MKVLEFNNLSVAMMVLEKAIIKDPVTAGSSKTITLDNNDGFSEDDFVLIGEIGDPTSEIAQINTAVAGSTNIQVDSLGFPHDAGVPVYKIPYNQVNFYHADTLTGDKTLLDTLDIDADSKFTRYVDETNTAGYLFFTMYNSETTDESGYSAGFNYGTIPYGTRIKIREFVTSPHNWNQDLDEETFNALCDFAESEIFSVKRWRFREKVVSFTTVAEQQSYTKAEAGATDIGQLIYATYDDNPVWATNLRTHKRLNWNNNQVGTPRTVVEFDDSLEFTPTPSEAKTVKLYYYRNSIGFTNESTESEVKLPQAIGFRVLQDLWATVDVQKSQYFEKRYLQTIAAMKLDDFKQSSKFPTLSNAGFDDANRIIDQTEYPNRIS
jgi:hypothetical protein